MTPQERRIGIAGIHLCLAHAWPLPDPAGSARRLCRDLAGGDDRTLIGLALGAYGLTQAVLQIPFGMASDRFGRKPVIVFGLLLFALGSFVAAWAPDMHWMIAGRAAGHGGDFSGDSAGGRSHA